MNLDQFTKEQRLFTEEELQYLREAHKEIHAIDVESKYYQRLLAVLDTMPLDLLEQVSTANIKFLSVLARNRVWRAKK